MKKYIKITFITTLLALLFSQIISASSENFSDSDPHQEYYGIRINGQLCGYSISTHDTIEEDGVEYGRDNVQIFLLLSLFGNQLNTEMRFEDVTDPVTGRTVRYEIEIDQGDTHREAEIFVKKDTAYITSILGDDVKKLPISDDVIFGDAHMIRRVSEDLKDNSVHEAVYTHLAPMDGKLEKVRVKYLGEDTIVLNEKSYEVWIFEHQSEETGMKTKTWVDAETDGMLQFQVRNRLVFKADRSVVDKIKLTDIDASLMTKTNRSIGDIQAITYMKVDAHIEPTGMKVTADDLSVPGQKFEGTVTNNKIEGTFEIEHKRYDGTNAPPFPHNYGVELENYLSSKDVYEADDPVLIEKALEITNGSTNSWEAAVRLSTWVAGNIRYAIPGGGTPRNTYELRAGECGAHSMLLATFCRAVGIPSRVVWGAMYVPNFGGAFGQHAWTEIYMGSAGWIPVDATAYENDFLDSGHIRIGEYKSVTSSFNGRAIKILDHHLVNQTPEDSEASAKYSEYLGNYSAGTRNLFVKVENNGLVLDIPGKAVLPFNDPDDSGSWYCKIAPQIYIEFTNTGENEVATLNFHQLMKLKRIEEENEDRANVPMNVKAFVGQYNLPGTSFKFNIYCKNDSLYFQNTAENRISLMQRLPDSENVWTDVNLKTYYFDLDENGIASAVKIDVLDKLYRE